MVLLIAIRWDWVEGGEARQGIELALWHQSMVPEVQALRCLLLCVQYLRSTLGVLVIGILESDADFEVSLQPPHPHTQTGHTLIYVHCVLGLTCTALQVDPSKLPSGASLEANQKTLEKLVWDTWRAITQSHGLFPAYVS